jgi:dihydrofolate reductase
VDEFHLMIHPVVIGAGRPYWPPDVKPMRLELVATQSFSSGAQFLAYRKASG